MNKETTVNDRGYRWVLALGIVGLTHLACGSDDAAPSASAAPPAAGGGDAVLPAAECAPSCKATASRCGAPPDVAEDQCAGICEAATKPQLDCLAAKRCEELEGVTSQAALDRVCPKTKTKTGPDASSGAPPATSAGKFGDACKCRPDTTNGAGEFECAGTGICSAGLRCRGSRTVGVDEGTCVGPVCCTSEADCEAKLGTQANCGAGLKCGCRGGTECVGTKCTCLGGSLPSSGLCNR